MHTSIDLSEDARRFLDAVPFPMFVVDTNLTVRVVNSAAGRLSADEPEYVLRRLCGEALSCIHENESDLRCGETDFCPECAIRQAVDRAHAENRAVHARQEMVVQRGDEHREVFFEITASPFDRESGLVLLILADVTEIMSLRRIVPICASCKKVRSDREFWEQVELFFTRYANVEFTHGLCPECALKYDR